MIKTFYGDVLDIETGIICHQTNCISDYANPVWGSGIALQIKNRFPKAYEACKGELRAFGNLKLGNITFAEVKKDLFIVNMNAQKRTGSGKQTSYDALNDCFFRLYHEYVYKEMNAVRSCEQELPICFPKLGAGLGGGDWKVISAIIDANIPDTIEKRLYIIE